MKKEITEESYRKLREKSLEISEILLTVFDQISSKEELMELKETSFHKVFTSFIQFVVAIEWTGDKEESVRKAAPIYLKKIEDSISKVLNLKEG